MKEIKIMIRTVNGVTSYKVWKNYQEDDTLSLIGHFEFLKQLELDKLKNTEDLQNNESE